MELGKFFITKKMTIRSAIEQLDKTAKKILLVLEDKKLVGIVTDGDIRRWLLKNGDLALPVELIMNTKPIFLPIEERIKGESVMIKHSIEAIPLVDKEQEVVDILFWNQLYENRFYYSNTGQTPVVIMAGGKGTRLYPYTKIIPKPLIPIGDIPIVERIINHFLAYNFNQFYLTMNYKKEMIKAYFNQNLPYALNLIEENMPLGTAGSLSLLGAAIKDTFFVSNCDVLIEANYSHILKYHKDNCHKITIVTVLKKYTIPYGVVSMNEKGCVAMLNEKPEYEFLVNAGMYVLEPDVLNYIPKDTYFDMTNLINVCLAQGEQIGTYPVTDSAWLDMGEFKEMQNMIERLK
ncbi:MAG: nucleotidyltransferase family protein [Cellulosilyticaceae bacterium]